MAERVIVLRTQEEKRRREKLKRKRMSQGLENIGEKHPVLFSENGGRDYDHESEGLGIGYQTRRRSGNGNDRRYSKSARVDEEKDMDCDENYLSPTSQPSPGFPASEIVALNELDMLDLAVGQTPEPRTPDMHPLPSSTSISAGLLGHEPLRGLHMVITHVKDTLEDDVDVAGNILASLERLEKDRKLGCTFLLSEQGSSFYF